MSCDWVSVAGRSSAMTRLAQPPSAADFPVRGPGWLSPGSAAVETGGDRSAAAGPQPWP